MRRNSSFPGEVPTTLEYFPLNEESLSLECRSSLTSETVGAMAFLFLVRNVRVLGSKAHLAQGHLVEERLKQANSQVGTRSGRKAFASHPPPPLAQAFSLVPHPPWSCIPPSGSSAFRAELSFHDSIFWRGIISGS